MVPIRCAETSSHNYQSTLRNIPGRPNARHNFFFDFHCRRTDTGKRCCATQTRWSATYAIVDYASVLTRHLLSRHYNVVGKTDFKPAGTQWRCLYVTLSWQPVLFMWRIWSLDVIVCIRNEPAMCHAAQEIAGDTVWTGDNGFVGCLPTLQHFVQLNT
jgi:hypothetical protein